MTHSEETRRHEERRTRAVRQLESDLRELGKLYGEAVALGDEPREARYAAMLREREDLLRRFDPTGLRRGA